MASPSDTRPTRRRFLDWILGTAAGGFLASVLYPPLRYLVPPPSEEAVADSVTLGIDPAELPPNSGKIFRFGSKPGILVRTPAGELRAFSAICTHLACTVQYREDLQHIWCACHNGHFDLQGRNVAGPPPTPLERYTVRESGGRVHVSRQV